MARTHPPIQIVGGSYQIHRAGLAVISFTWISLPCLSCLYVLVSFSRAHDSVLHYILYCYIVNLSQTCICFSYTYSHSRSIKSARSYIHIHVGVGCVFCTPGVFFWFVSLNACSNLICECVFVCTLKVSSCFLPCASPFCVIVLIYSYPSPGQIWGP